MAHGNLTDNAVHTVFIGGRGLLMRERRRRVMRGVIFVIGFRRRRRCKTHLFILADDDRDDLTDVHDFVNLAVGLRKLAGLRHGNIGHNFVGLDFQQRITFFDHIAGLVIPLENLSFVNAFPDIGEEKIKGHVFLSPC